MSERTHVIEEPPAAEKTLTEQLRQLATAHWTLDTRRRTSADAVDRASAAARAVLEARRDAEAAAAAVGPALLCLAPHEFLVRGDHYVVAATDAAGNPSARLLKPVTLIELAERVEKAAKGGDE
jgi:hypothetical protein